MDDGQSSNAESAAVNGLSNRTRSGSASSGHKRSLSGSLLSRLSFLRMSQASAQPESGSHSMDQDGDSEDLAANVPQVTSEAPTSSRAMSAAIQQQRRTRRRRGSLRKTALLGTRFESREKRVTAKLADATPRYQGEVSPPQKDHASVDNGFSSRESLVDDDDGQPSWFSSSAAQKTLRSSVARRRQGLAPQDLLGGEETGTDDEELVSFPRITTANNTSANTGAPTTTGKASPTSGLHISTQSSASDSYYPLPTDTAYRPVHRNKSSPLAPHPVEIKNNADTWDYSETEWWGWIILIVTWLVFVVGMGSCFEVWSWAWDVGETPYAPPELEDDPTLPIVGYYPALIILTAVMSWVWVVVAWVGMKYFKHANISGDDS
ncbi:hypothetical protein N7462_005523 [Penicillium macrosclerotiorum]|uniref:uncharacterized protein n=1 Tax=Penicillium macrosclerotiorum TaxID=303699 RepID=UPI0025490CA1|nr:uncharacterized protein N7462_005523 [Penicillium macrosclerotiorum]KAJ5682358.1 hypothetical protein N7462_005523 [Penicillium macrosclerotiorum]